jgi:glycine/D-amino acid oxidase-like deaminating enzyme
MTLSQHGAIVIGAGVAGLSTALYLQRAGVAVAAIDPLPPAGGFDPAPYAAQPFG